MRPIASIIIRAYNGEKTIEECLNAIFNQKTNFPFEVLLVDSESQDRTLETARKFSVRVFRIKKKDFSYGKSLNLGCLKAKGKYCISLSQDAIPANRLWMINLLKPLKNEGIAGVYGRQIQKKNCNPFEARRISGTFKQRSKIQNKDYFFTTSGCAFRRELWLKNKFDCDSYAEDLVWAKRMLDKGYTIYYQSEAIVKHSNNYGLFSLYKHITKDRYDKYKKIEKKGTFFIISEGFTNFIHSVYQDLIFLINKKKPVFWVFVVIPYNLMILIAFINAALRQNK